MRNLVDCRERSKLMLKLDFDFGVIPSKHTGGKVDFWREKSCDIALIYVASESLGNPTIH